MSKPSVTDLLFEEDFPKPLHPSDPPSPPRGICDSCLKRRVIKVRALNGDLLCRECAADDGA